MLFRSRRAREDAQRVRLVDAARPLADIQRELAQIVEPLCR